MLQTTWFTDPSTASVARQQTVCNTGVPKRYRQHGLQTTLQPMWSDNRPYVTLEFLNAIDNMVYRPLYRQCGQTTDRINTGVPKRYRQHGLQTPLPPVWPDNRPYVINT